MKSKKFILVFLIIMGILLFASGCNGSKADLHIAVITKGTTSEFWRSVKKGVESAETEYNVSCTFSGPSSEEDYETQNRMIENAVNDGADAIVFSAIDYYKSTETIERAINAGVKVVLIDSGIETDREIAFIGTDNYEAGVKACEAALAKLPKGQTAVVGLINYDEYSDNGRQRERGFRDRLAKEPGAVIASAVNINSTAEEATEATVKMLSENSGINIIVGFNEWTTLGVGYGVKELGLSESVTAVGFDSNVVSIGMLETGEMDALIVQNPFAIGYLGVQSAHKLLNGKTLDPETVTETTAVTAENMFDSDIQKILFKFE